MASRRHRRRCSRPAPGEVRAVLDGYAALAGVPAPVRTIAPCRARGGRGLVACGDGRRECEACEGTGRVAVEVELTDPDR